MLFAVRFFYGGAGEGGGLLPAALSLSLPLSQYLYLYLSLSLSLSPPCLRYLCTILQASLRYLTGLLAVCLGGACGLLQVKPLRHKRFGVSVKHIPVRGLTTSDSLCERTRERFESNRAQKSCGTVQVMQKYEGSAAPHISCILSLWYAIQASGDRRASSAPSDRTAFNSAAERAWELKDFWGLNSMSVNHT